MHLTPDHSNPYTIQYFAHQSPPIRRYIFSLFTFYYIQYKDRYIPIAMSKPNSTQKPYFYQLSHPTFPTLQSLLNHYTSHNPLK